MAAEVQDSMPLRAELYINEAKYNRQNDSLKYNRLDSIQSKREKLTRQDSIELSRGIDYIGKKHGESGDIHKSIEAHHQALALQTQLFLENSTEMIESLGNLGMMFLSKNELDSSYVYLSEAVELIEQLDPPKPLLRAGMYTRMGSLYNKYLDYDRSNYYLEKAHQIQLEFYPPHDSYMVYSYLNLSSILIQLGEYSRAGKYVRIAEELISKQENLPPLLKIVAKMNLGILLLKESKPAKAELVLRETLLIQESQIETKDQSYARIHMLLGESLMQQKKYIAASAEFAEAKQTIVAIQGELDPFLFHIMELDARNQYFLNNWETSLDISNTVLSHKEEMYGTDHYEVIYSQHLKSKLLILQGAYDEAYALLQDNILKIERSEWMIYDPINVSIHISLTDLLLKKSAGLELQELEECIYKTDKLIQIQRAEILEVSDQFIKGQEYESFFSNVVNYFADKSIQNGNNEAEASLFYFIEQAKGNSLFQSLRNTYAWEKNQLPESILNEKQKLEYEINQLKFELKDTTDSDSALENKLLIIDKQKAYLSLLEDIENTYPEYYETKYQIKRIPFLEFQEGLDTDELVLNYFFSDNHLVTLSTTKDKVFVTKKDFTETESDCLQRMLLLSNTHDQVQTQTDKIALLDKFADNSFCLFEDLLAEHLNHHDKKRKLFIIPHKTLNLLPFETLCTAQNQSANSTFKSLPYLIHDYTVMYLYSASLPQYNRVDDLDSYVGFAPEFTPKTNETSAYFDLPYSRGQVLNIAKQLGGKSFIGPESTISNLNENITNYDIVHISTHASWDSIHSLQSKLLLSGSDGVGLSHLSVEDVYQLRLAASLVVLSACQTGVGDYINGEGPIHFSHAFKHAGAKSTWMSLWSIPEQASADIISTGLEMIESGVSSDEAMRIAKLNYIHESAERTASPFYWGGLVSVGQIEIHKTSSHWLVFSLIILLVVSSILYYVQKNKILIP